MSNTTVGIGLAYGEALCAMAKGIEANGYIDVSENSAIKETYYDYRSKLDYNDRRDMEQYVWNNMAPQTRDLMRNAGWFEFRWW